VENPELKGKPVVVGGRPHRRGVVAAASYEARAFGLHAGMPLITAGRLCPQAIFIEGSFPKYRQASQEFMAILADFSPYLEPMGLDEAYLDVTGFGSIYGSIHLMALAQESRPVRLIGIGVSNLTESGRQLDMLDPSARRLEQLTRAIDRIRKKYGFAAIQTGRTLLLKDIFPSGDNGYTLNTPSLSR